MGSGITLNYSDCYYQFNDLRTDIDVDYHHDIETTGKSPRLAYNVHWTSSNGQIRNVSKTHRGHLNNISESCRREKKGFLQTFFRLYSAMLKETDPIEQYNKINLINMLCGIYIENDCYHDQRLDITLI